MAWASWQPRPPASLEALGLLPPWLGPALIVERRPLLDHFVDNTKGVGLWGRHEEVALQNFLCRQAKAGRQGRQAGRQGRQR